MTASPTSPRFLYACGSDVGRVRKRNEDMLRVDAERGWAVLADGMGGYRGGDVAATLAVEGVMRYLGAEFAANGGIGPERMAETLRDSIEEANVDIFHASIEGAELTGMGSTVVVVAFLPGRLFCAHAGDSRLYRFRDATLQPLTRDHSMLQELVDSGIVDPEVARTAHFRGMLTRGLGAAVDVNPDVVEYDVVAGDIYLLCSDGLTDMLMDEEIAEEFARSHSLEHTARRLVELANEHGGRDNISVIVLQPQG